MLKNDKVIVTGGDGFVGSHLTKYFRSKGIYVIDRNAIGDRSIDVTNFDELLSTSDNAKAIVHLAAKTSVDSSFSSPYETYYTNLLGTLNLLELTRRKKIAKFLNVSTYVYGQPKYLPIDEDHPIDPGSPYNKSKVLAEELCKFYSGDFGIDIVTLRPFYLYGSYPRHGSFIYWVIQQMVKQDGTVTLSGTSTKRDFLYISDFMDLINAILCKFPSGYNVYNVGYGQSYTLTEVVQIIAKLLKKEISIRYDNEMRPGDVTDMIADNSKVIKAFDWRPSTSLHKGLEYTLEQYM